MPRPQDDDPVRKPSPVLPYRAEDPIDIGPPRTYAIVLAAAAAVALLAQLGIMFRLTAGSGARAALYVSALVSVASIAIVVELLFLTARSRSERTLRRLGLAFAVAAFLIPLPVFFSMM